jgi:uncharacterized protein YecE (DUF72 family)
MATFMSYLDGSKIRNHNRFVKQYLEEVMKESVQYSIGIAGWEHESFDQCLYGTPTEYSCVKLRYYARFFDTVEIRQTFWDDELSAHDALQWMDAVVDNKRFRFNVKLHRSFTHEKLVKPERATRVREMLHELLKQDRLGALLVQLPYSFTNTSANRFHLVKLAEVFRGFPIHVEFRNDSWNDVRFLMNFMEENALRPVNADLPRINKLMPFVTSVLGDSAYVRLHGRNEKGWMVNGMDTRYDYSYNARELREIARRLTALEEKAKHITVIFNNTTGGKAIANALQLISILREGKPILVPQAISNLFPDLMNDVSVVIEDSLFAGEKIYRKVG